MELLRYLPPNVTALIWICGNVFAIRRVDGRFLFRRLEPRR